MTDISTARLRGPALQARRTDPLSEAGVWGGISGICMTRSFHRLFSDFGRPARLASVASLVCSAGVAIGGTASDLDGNIGRYRFATGSSVSGQAVGQFATDGKLGPENSWVTNNRGRHRLNLFFDRPSEIGRVHVYSGGLGNGPVDTLSLQYLDGNGLLQTVPGASISGNTEGFIDLVLPTPVTTTQLQVTIQDTTATVQEVAVFPPSATGFPFGSGVNPHLARQHRLALTTASSTIGGSSRRAVVDGFVNDTDYWECSAVANNWIMLDLRDPPETNPATVRTVTTPVEIGSVHLYSGLESGAAPISRGRFQTLDENSGAWVDVPGGAFSNNTAGEFAVEFSAPVTTAAMRLVVQDAGAIVREIVPLPPTGVAGGWPMGSGVMFGDEPDYLEFGDGYHALEIDRSQVALTSNGDGVTVRAQSSMMTQHYQVLLNVGSDTYRIRSRVTGLCLEPLDGSVNPGAAIVESAYAGFPSQRWRMEEVPGGKRFVNSRSGLILSAITETDGSALEQRADGGVGQAWTVEYRAHPSKKGTGGFPTLSGVFENRWAYNWGPDDTFPADVEFWPMQWGSFNWSQRPSLMPIWMRNPEGTVLMGYNEPDKVDQSNMPVSTAASMWPRLEILNMPLLGPAVAGDPATSGWIQGFMAEAASDELRLEYVGMHSYGGPNANSFINKITAAHNAWDRDVVVSEFSVVDWSDTNNWTTDSVYNWFTEVLWRMELLPYLHKYAVFIFTDEPGNPVSDNRGEMREADGSLTPSGKLYAAWDGDTQVRTDTPYYLHNKASFTRPGAVAGQTGDDSTVLGGRYDGGDDFQWRLEPTETPGLYNIRSVSDGTLLTYSARGLELQESGGVGSVAEFGIDEIQHGWFAIIEPALNRRLSSATSGGAISLASAGTTNDNVRWRFVPVLGGRPGPVRGGVAESIGGGDVALSWDEHGFRDLIGFTVYRSGPGGGTPEAVAADVMGESWIDRVPEPGTYTYLVSAVGDTGESDLAPLGAVSVDTCPADFNADFVVDAGDTEAAIAAIGTGLDYDGSGAADFFDVLAFLRVHDEGCPGN